LVLDEVITFRGGYGGAQDDYSMQPDLTAMGKMIGGGFPVGALAGRRDVMEVMNPLRDRVLFPHSGTFSANPVTMVAGLTAMTLFDQPALTRLNALNEQLRAQITEAIRVAGVPACVTGGGSMFRIHMKPEPPQNYRATYADPEEVQIRTALLDHLFEKGMMMINTCSGTLSTAMGNRELDMLTEVLLEGFRRFRPMFQTHG
ncbi:MAG: aminotransferase class III-fold pyridoxal phosphate-dependent enzyme, partial [Myxococcota bacterium]|nr:aminotransferase class III-fold pyridoxal phosphate-dependent enzyme [Myxococcota bacterium]